MHLFVDNDRRDVLSIRVGPNSLVQGGCSQERGGLIDRRVNRFIRYSKKCEPNEHLSDVTLDGHVNTHGQLHENVFSLAITFDAVVALVLND
mgnify:CR=1 FL=1